MNDKADTEETNRLTVGVLALQGAFAEHMAILKQLGVGQLRVVKAEQLEQIDGLIIPGGESTTIGKLATQFELMEPLKHFAQKKPVWGTCAGMIFMAKKIDPDQPLLRIMDIEVERNAFGRQVDSFEIDLPVAILDNGINRPFHCVFIRAPRLVGTGDDVSMIARLPDGTGVAAVQNHLLVTSFHPELTDDDRFHRFFLNKIEEITPIIKKQ